MTVWKNRGRLDHEHLSTWSFTHIPEEYMTDTDLLATPFPDSLETSLPTTGAGFGRTLVIAELCLGTLAMIVSNLVVLAGRELRLLALSFGLSMEQYHALVTLKIVRNQTERCRAELPDDNLVLSSEECLAYDQCVKIGVPVWCLRLVGGTRADNTIVNATHPWSP